MRGGHERYTRHCEFPSASGVRIALQRHRNRFSGGSPQRQRLAVLLSGGGRAVYQFTVPANGIYSVRALVNAPSGAANSFYVNMDAEPTDPHMVWDVLPVTSGFQFRSVSWRGNGTFELNEFDPKVFTLSAGEHSLIVIGREPGAALDRLEIRSEGLAPSPPTNLRVVTGG